MTTRTLSERGASSLFESKFAGQFSAILHGFDRLRLRGTLRQLYCPRVMAAYLNSQRVLLKEFNELAERTTGALKAAAEAFAREWKRPVEYLNSSQRSKEEIAREIATRDGVREGLIVVLKAVEPCRSYTVMGRRETRQLELRLGTRKCLHYYFYFEHPVFGFMHLRLQSWFPFEINVCLNGHHWLARQFDAAGLDYRKRENALVWVEDPVRAQEFLDAQVRFAWEPELERLVQLVHPTSAAICAPLSLRYYWSFSDSEYASDVLFHDSRTLGRLHPHFVHHAVRSFQCGDVMRFLGRKVTTSGGVPGQFKGEIISDLKQRPEGIRVKHSLNSNSLKFYDKQGSVLRVETTIVRPEEFKVYRRPESQSDGDKRWLELRRGVADSERRAQVSRAANKRYLEALAATTASTTLFEATRRVCRHTTWKHRRHRALQPLSEADCQLLQAVSRGEFSLRGFRARDLIEHLDLPRSRSRAQARKNSAAIGRRLRILRAHHLVRKLGRSHRYLVTPSGHQIITLLLAALQADIDKLTSFAA